MEKNPSKHTYLHVLLFTLVLFPLFPQVVWSDPIKQVTINYIEAAAAPDKLANQVSVFVTVSGADEKSISGLSISEFEAVEDGKKISIDEVSQATDPMSIVLAIDTSGSMQARDKSGLTSMEAAKNAAIDFISMLSQDDRVALFSFNNEPTLQLDFTVDHEMVVDSIKALAAKNKAATCLFDTAFEAVKKSAEIPKGRRAIILLTDGKDEKGAASAVHIIQVM
jgi:VWFA-related protein